MCEIPLTVAGASIIVQKISPSFQVFLLRKTRDYVLCMAKQCNFQKGVWQWWYVCSFKTLFTRIQPPLFNEGVSSQNFVFYYFYSKLNEVLKHILRNYEWSLSYILQIIFLLLPFTLHRKQLIHESSLENVLSRILFKLRSAQYYVWITGYLYQYQTFANFAKLGKQKTKKRIKNANCILQRLRGEKAFGGTKKGVSEE